MLAALFLVTAPLFAKEPLSLITISDVNKSLEENAATWLAKIDAQGRPRLLYNKAGLAGVKARLMTGQRSPEVTALLTEAYALVPSIPRPYISPADNAKKSGSNIDGDEELWIRAVGDEVTMLTVAASLDPSPVLTNALHDAVIGICGYPTWGRSPGESNDLACAHAARGVALAWDWFPELWTNKDRELIIQTITYRANQLASGLYGKAYWAKRYADNHNQVDCCALAWCGLAFYTDIPKAPEWLAAARLDFQKVALSLPEDGSSAEGVPYWSYGISYILQYIEGTRGIIDSADFYQTPFLKNAAAYRLNASTCGMGATLPWGDAGAKDYYGPQHMLNRLAVEYQNPAASWLSHRIQWQPEGYKDVLAWTALWQTADTSQPTLPLDYHHWSTDMVTTRSGWGGGDYLLAIKSGFTNRNHSHLDAGALAFAFGSEWILTAPGYGKGSGSPDFWNSEAKRWTFFSNATESHCTLLINGKNQRFDNEARGTIDQFFSTPYWSWTGINLTEAYHDISSVRREVLHRRNDYILVFDAVAAKQSASRVDSPVHPLAPRPTTTVEWLAQFSNKPEQDGNSLNAKAESGQLRIEMLSPSARFTSRSPTSARVDSGTDPLTYAVKNSGETVSFIALLQPSFSVASMPALKATVAQSNPGVVHLVLKGSDWTDDIFKNDIAESLKLNSLILTSGQEIKSTATITVIRTEAQGVTSCIAMNASALEVPGVTIQLNSPANIGLQKMPNGSWLLDANKDIQEQLMVSKEFTIKRIEPSKNQYRYLIGKNEASSSQALQWLTSILVFREKAPLQVRTLALQPVISSTVSIPIEAKNFSHQHSGNAIVVDGKLGVRGKSVKNFGCGSPEHSIRWKFEVPQDGQYQLSIRYATDLRGVQVGVLVDGAAPAQDLLRLPTPSTGGWSNKQDNWTNMVVRDSHGQAFVFNLARGTHELCLAKPTGALGLDRFEFRGVGP